MAQITPEEGSFKKLLNQDVVYNVPMYQRNYSWEQQHWEDLWDDICTLIETKESHYMGPVVFKQINSNSFEIIDGQQRFCTITLIVIATIKLINERTEEDYKLRAAIIDDLKRRYIGIETPLSAKRKLHLNKYDDSFFEINIVGGQEPTQKDKNKLLYNALCFFYTKLKDFYKDMNSQQIAEFIDKFLLENLSFFIIRVLDDVNAYVIFETLNARGLELSNTDLIKNYLFSLVPQKEENSLAHIEKCWGRIVELVGYKNLPQFMRYYWNSKYKFVRNMYLFKELKIEIDSYKKINKFFEDVEKAAEVYVALSDKENKYWDNYQLAGKEIEELKILSNGVFKVLALSCARNLPKEIENCLKICKVIAFRNMIVGKNPNEFEKIYSKVAIDIENKRISSFRQIKTVLKEFYIRDDEFRDAFKNRILKYKSQKKIIKYILLNLEKDESKNNHKDENTVSIEHILPNHPNNNWNKIFNNRADEFIERIANYTLLTTKENKDCDGLDFNDKKLIYAKTKFQITKKLSQLAVWNINELEELQKKYAERAQHIWRIDFKQ